MCLTVVTSCHFFLPQYLLIYPFLANFPANPLSAPCSCHADYCSFLLSVPLAACLYALSCMSRKICCFSCSCDRAPSHYIALRLLVLPARALHFCQHLCFPLWLHRFVCPRLRHLHLPRHSCCLLPLLALPDWVNEVVSSCTPASSCPSIPFYIAADLGSSNSLGVVTACARCVACLY